jgi:hypothetical protein
VESLLYVAAGVIGGTGFWLIVDGYRSGDSRRRRPDLTERLLPYHCGIAEEAEAWLTQEG